MQPLRQKVRRKCDPFVNKCPLSSLLQWASTWATSPTCSTSMRHALTPPRCSWTPGPTQNKNQKCPRPSRRVLGIVHFNLLVLLPLPSLSPLAPQELTSRLKGHRHRVAERFGHLSPSAFIFYHFLKFPLWEFDVKTICFHVRVPPPPPAPPPPPPPPPAAPPPIQHPPPI